MGAQPRVSQVVGGQVRRHRKRRGWTQQRLAEAISDHGGTLSRGAVAKVESGVRDVSIDEFLLLAAALNVPPPLLLVPLGGEVEDRVDRVEVTPRSRIHPHLALEWLCGNEPLVNSAHVNIDRAGWLFGSEPLRLWNGLRLAQEAIADVPRGVRSAGYSGEEAILREAKQNTDTLEALHAHLRRMQSAGEWPPALHPDTLLAMRTLGLDVDGLEEAQLQEHDDQEAH